MAHLTGREDRAQLILIAGFVIAVSLVGLALVVNTAIFTENLATRSQTSGAVDALSYRSSVHDNTASVIKQVNDDEWDQSYTTLNETVRANLEEYGQLSGRHQSLADRYANVSVVDHTPGVVIYQNATATFNSATPGDNENWTLESNVDNVRNFSITLEDDGTTPTLADRLEHRRHFTINVTTPSVDDWWKLNVSRTATGDNIVAVNASGQGWEACSTPVTTTINVTAGTIDGSDCGAINFTEWQDDKSFDLQFENGSKIEGTYWLEMDKDVAALASAQYGTATDDPSADTILYSVQVKLDYQTRRFDYETQFRVEPGDSND